MRTPKAAMLIGAGLMAVGLSGEALAQSVESRIDQPTPATLPPGTHATAGTKAPANQPTGRVDAPSTISSSVDVMQGDKTSQGQGGATRTDPIQHLPRDMR